MQKPAVSEVCESTIALRQITISEVDVQGSALADRDATKIQAYEYGVIEGTLYEVHRLAKPAFRPGGFGPVDTDKLTVAKLAIDKSAAFEVHKAEVARPEDAISKCAILEHAVSKAAFRESARLEFLGFDDATFMIGVLELLGVVLSLQG